VYSTNPLSRAYHTRPGVVQHFNGVPNPAQTSGPLSGLDVSAKPKSRTGGRAYQAWVSLVLSRGGKTKAAYAAQHGLTPIRANEFYIWPVAPGETILIPGMVCRLDEMHFVCDDDTVLELPFDTTTTALSPTTLLYQRMLTMPKSTVRDVKNFSGPGAGAELVNRPTIERAKHLLGVAQKAPKTDANMNLIFAQAEQLSRQFDAELQVIEEGKSILQMVGEACID
jgi:hypothetical protein